MPEASGYESHLSREAVAFVVGSSKKKQRLVLDLADQIARQPSRISDYRKVDAVGLFSYWVDHGSREVRNSDVVRV